VDHAADGEEGLRLAGDGDYDVAIVDVMLPKLDGLSLIKELRRRKMTTPVLILSARHTVDDRVVGLEAGGDTKALASGDAIIKIDGAGLQPHLEAFMWEILKAVQVRANRDGLAFLLGV